MSRLCAVSILWAVVGLVVTSRPAAAVDASRFVAAANALRETGSRDPQRAFLAAMTADALRTFSAQANLAWPVSGERDGWSFFFGSSVYGMRLIGDAAALTAFYNPWGDMALLALWEETSSGVCITDAQIVMGDFLRRAGQEPYETVPLWLRLENAPLLLPAEASFQTIQAFQQCFERLTKNRHASRWRAQLAPLQDPGALQTVQYGAMLSIESSLVTLDAFLTKPEFRNTRRTAELALDWLSKGRAAEVFAAASETLPEVRATLESEMKGRWLDASAVAILDAPESAYVFLQCPPAGDVYIDFFFRKKNGRSYLRRIDFVNQQAFVANRLAGQELPPPTLQPAVQVRLPDNGASSTAARPVSRPAVVAPAAGDQPPPLPSGPAVWFVGIDGRQTGPFDLAALRDMAGKGILARTSLVWKKGMANWTAIGDVAELKSVFGE